MNKCVKQVLNQILHYTITLTVSNTHEWKYHKWPFKTKQHCSLLSCVFAAKKIGSQIMSQFSVFLMMLGWCQTLKCFIVSCKPILFRDAMPSRLTIDNCIWTKHFVTPPHPPALTSALRETRQTPPAPPQDIFSSWAHDAIFLLGFGCQCLVFEQPL